MAHKIREHQIQVKFGQEALPLQGSATCILSLAGISEIQFINKPIANGDFDIYWYGRKDAVEIRVYGDRWERDALQSRLTVELIGGGAMAMAQELTQAMHINGWQAEFTARGKKYV